MNGPLIDAAKRILKRIYGVECTEPFAGVDRFRRTTGNSVAQVSLEAVKGGPVYKLSLYGFCYDNDEIYEEKKQIKTTESTNPIDIAELIDEYLSRVETNLAILVKQHRPYSKKKRILSLGEAKELLGGVGYRLISEQSDRFRTAWNSLLSAMSDYTNWNRVVIWYAGNKYWENAKDLCNDYDRGQCSLQEIVEKMKAACVQWYRDLFKKVNDILSRHSLEVTGDRGEFRYGDESYKIVPVGRSGSGCSFEIRNNSDTNTPQIHSEDDVYARTPFIENQDDALGALEKIVEEKFSDMQRKFSEAKELLTNAGFIVEATSMYSVLYDFYRFLNAKAPKTGYDLEIEGDENSITVKFLDNVALVTLEEFDEDEDPMLHVEAGGNDRIFYNEHSDWGNALQFIIKKICPTNESKDK